MVRTLACPASKEARCHIDASTSSLWPRHTGHDDDDDDVSAEAVKNCCFLHWRCHSMMHCVQNECSHSCIVTGSSIGCSKQIGQFVSGSTGLGWISKSDPSNGGVVVSLTVRYIDSMGIQYGRCSPQWGCWQERESNSIPSDTASTSFLELAPYTRTRHIQCSREEYLWLDLDPCRPPWCCCRRFDFAFLLDCSRLDCGYCIGVLAACLR